MKGLRYPLAFLAILCPLVHADGLSQVDGDATTTAIVEITPYRFKAKSIDGCVIEAVDQCKEGFTQPLNQLFEESKGDTDKVLKLLEPYFDGANDDLQLALSEEIVSAPKSAASLHALIRLLSNGPLGYITADAIYNNYTASQVVKGGTALKSALLRSAIASRNTTRGYLLLSCYKGDSSITQFLQKRRLSFEVKPVPGQDIASPARNQTGKILPTDLALTELGDLEALKRVEQTFAGGVPVEIIALLRDLKFVNNKSVLAAAIAQLQNKATYRQFFSTVSDEVTSVRVCDAAFPLLRSRFTPSLETSPGQRRITKVETIWTPRTDEEIRDAYQRFSALLDTIK